MDASILFALDAPLPLWRRTLWALAQRPPSCSFEVIVAATDHRGLDELSLYSARFRWKYVLCKKEEGELTEWAAGFAEGRLLVGQGASVIVWGDGYDALVRPVWAGEPKISLGSVLELPQHLLLNLDLYGGDLSVNQVNLARRWPVCTPEKPGDGKYLFVSPREAWRNADSWEFSQAVGLLQSNDAPRWAPPEEEVCRPSLSMLRFPPLPFPQADHPGVVEVRSNVLP